MATATGKVRIFELAKELNMSSKDLLALFGRLGLEAKNQLSVVDEKIADLLRAQLGRTARSKAASAAAPAAPASAAATAAPPAAQQRPAAAPARPAAPPQEPIPTLRPVSGAPRRAAPAAPAPAADVAAPAAANGAAAAADRAVASASANGAAAPAADAAAPVEAAASPPVAAEAPAPAASVAEPTVTPAAETPRAEAPAAPPSDAGAPAPAATAPRESAPKAAAPSAPAAANGAPPAEGAARRPAGPTQGPRSTGPRSGQGPQQGPRPTGGPQGTSRPGQPGGQRPLPPRPMPRPAVSDQPVPTLRPVPRGQSSIVPPRPPQPQTPPANPAASAAPGPQTGLPGRPGVAPRPGQAVPGSYRPGQPGAPGQPRPGQQPGAPGAPGGPGGRQRVSNGPFRPLTPPGGRPFTPRPGGGPGAPPAQQGPTPSSGAPGAAPGRGRGRDRDDDKSKKDREKELLLEKQRSRKRGSLDAAPAIQPAQLENIEIPDVLTVQELATSMIVPAKDVIKELIKMGTMATINQNISSDQATAIARKFGFNAIVKEAGEEVAVEQEEDKPEMMTARPPVVTVLGHVDHGKTSLLDKIRSANVAAGEAGGITQRIGAYTIDMNDRKITFIDTPGHEAFTAMRARGAKVTDVAILVVAADDGVMPQTVEAISHIKAAGVPIVVAINKMDREDAQPDRVKTQLSEQGLQPVDWGGNVEMVPVSARTGMGIDGLLETVLLEADIRDLKANRNRRASGVVIESALDRGRGAVATVLVQNGTLRVGDVVVVGPTYGKVRALVDDTGKQVKKAGPSIPVEIMGLGDVPSAGDTLMVVSDEKAAREAAAKRQTKRRDVRMAASSGPRVSLESFMSMAAEGGKKTLNLVLKADGQGAVEALRARVEGLSNAEVEINVILAGVGAITPNDVNLASASNAVLIGFNIRPDETVKRLADNEQVDLRFYQVIYEVEDDLKKAMRGMLAPKFREIIVGRAEVREIFKVSKVGTIAGCYVQSGKLVRNAKVRVLRDQAVVFESELESLRRFKDDVREVNENFECGVQVARFADLKQGDVIEAFASEMVAPELVPA